MIHIYRSSWQGEVEDCEINVFRGRDYVTVNEVVVKTKTVFGKVHKYAEPNKPGNYAFGGTFLHTSNGCFPDFNDPVPLHDRDMNKEK